MNFISAEDLDRLFTFEGVTDALRDAFAEGVQAPLRHHHTIARPSGADQTLLLMPAWSNEVVSGHIGVKIATVTPDNGAEGLPAVMASYILMDGATGAPRALIDGTRLTLWRTSCASALAARYLAPREPDTLLVVGAGELAPFLARAHAAARPYRRIRIWNRSIGKAEALANALWRDGFDASAASDLDEAVEEADTISAATLSSVPLIKGALLTPGTHVDLVGAFTPQMRESDDDCVRRATVFVDTFEGATKEGGDIVQPLNDGVIARADIRADLAALTTGAHAGRSSDDEITLFKSTGAALEDLAAAILAAKLAG
ncbi:ornithine cyclodeaminase family protein [Oricola sp.]|uniref:ornithine cyclodeaminase family protein n=1 Tax=Oricola sp. TaxID=1979950 RepID=UPI0025F9D4D7|nr:ornithine cyclodeaminase family protein [Oricola sp.]MCI5077908.1 ornithine cyclodeaminase family protein [Oricola sp.]